MTKMTQFTSPSHGQDVDLREAQTFLDLLAPCGTITFQTFAESAREPAGLARILHGTLDTHAAQLETLNCRGAGVFVMVNEGDGKGRKAANVQTVRALVVDLDDAPLAPVLDGPLRPHLVVQSSPERYHAYWLAGDLPLEHFTPLQKAIAARFKGDPSVIDLCRVMRLPGFWHRKAVPFRTRLLEAHQHPPYTLAELEHAFGTEVPPRQRKRDTDADAGPIVEGGRNNVLTSLAGTMRRRGMSPEAIEQALLAENRARCEPPLSEREVADIARSVSRYAPADVDRQGTKPTHLDLARWVRHHLGNDNLIHTQSRFWSWRDAGVWQPTDEIAVRKIIQDVVESAGERVTSSLVGSVLSLLQAEIHAEHHTFDAPSEGINCRNGELWYENGCWVLKPHVREHYCTTQIPVSYDAAAACPRFTQFLGEIFEDDDDAPAKMRVVCELLGYSLLATCRYERFALLVGGGANGKSVLLEVVRALAGGGNAAAVQPSQFDNRFQRAHLQGKLVNVVTEIAEGAELAEAPLKAIVSGELTTAEHKHKPPFDFQPFATCWFGTNHMPHTRDFTDALFRRAIIIPFNRAFRGAQADPHLKETLRGELPGILNLALEAVAGVIRRGEFTEPASSARAKQDWRLQADQVASFVDECCELVSGEETSKHVYETYLEWAKGAGIRQVLGRKSFVNRLKLRGVMPVKRAGGERYLAGIRVVSPW